MKRFVIVSSMNIEVFVVALVNDSNEIKIEYSHLQRTLLFESCRKKMSFRSYLIELWTIY